MIAQRPSLNFATASVASGIVLSTFAAFYTLPHARRFRWLFSRADGNVSRTETKLEEIKDVHWEFADRAARYREVLDAQHEFIVRRLEDGRIVFANRAFCEAFNMRHEAVIGTKFEPPLIREELRSERPGTGLHIVQLLLTRKGKRWIAWDVRELANEGGEIETQSAGRDITIERTIEHEMKEACDQAEAGSRANRHFLLR